MTKKAVSTARRPYTKTALTSQTLLVKLKAQGLIVEDDVFESWLHTLTVLRNMAAHHARFLDVKTGVSPTNLKLKAIKFSDNSTVFASLTVIHILLEAIGFSEEFKMRLERMEDKYGIEHFQLMGFPEKWKTDSKGW